MLYFHGADNRLPPLLKNILLFFGSLILACSCSDRGNNVLVTTPWFDSVRLKADRIHDAGDKTVGLRMIENAHSHASHLTVADEVNYFGFCNVIYGNRKDYDKCIALSDNMLAILDRENGNDPQIKTWRTVTYNCKADALFAKGMYNDAYDNYYKALRLARENADFCSLRTYSYSLAMVLFRQQHYARAAASFKEAYAESATCPQSFNMFYFRQEVLDNIGLCYNALQQYDSAMHYYTRALAYLNEHTGAFTGKEPSVYEAPKAVVYGNMAEVFVHQGLYDTAKTLYNKSIGINLQKGYTNYDAIADQTKLASLYFSTGDIALMKQTLTAIRAELDTLPDQRVEIAWNKLMWQYHDHEHNVAEAYGYLRDYTMASEAYATANKGLMTTDLDTKVKDIEKQYKINLLTKDKQQQKIYLAIVTVIALMAFAIVFLIWRNAQKSYRNVTQLTKLNNMVNEQKKQLELALEELKIKEKDKSRILRSVAHDVMNPINAIVSLTDILSHESDSYTVSQQEIMALIIEACNNSLALSRDILEASVEIAHADIPKELTDINALVATSAELLSYQAIVKKQHIKINAPVSHIHAYVYKEKIWRVLNNLIANAIKFSYDGADIFVTLEQTEEDVHIIVKDTGVGIPEKNKPFIFDMFTDARVPGTSGEVPHGLGLSISLHIARAHNGNIWVESKQGMGSSFHLVFPIRPAN